MSKDRSFARRTFLLSLAASAVSAGLASCGSSNATTPTTGAAAPQPTTAGGGTISTVAATLPPKAAPTSAPVVGGGQAPSGGLPTPRNQTLVGETVKMQIFDSFNPFIPNGEQGNSGLAQGARECMFYANFMTDKIVPWLATKYEYNADFTQMTITLNPNVKWSDGQPYTSDDVLFTLDLLAKNPQFTGSSVVTTWVESATAPDKSTFVLKLKKPNPRYHYNFVARISDVAIKIVPKHIWEKQDAGTFKNNPPIYTGPYVLDRTIPEQFMYVWKKNPEYWNKANDDPKPQYLVWRQTLPADAIVQDFQRGNVDAVLGGQGYTFDYPLQQAVKNSYKNMIQVSFLDPCPRGLWLNQDSPSGLFQTAEGRRAISYMLDRDTIAKTIWQPPTTGAKYPWADWKANQKWQDATIMKKYELTFDMKQAEQLLDGLGATKNGDVRQLNGKPLALTVITPVAVGLPEYQIAQALAGNAKKLGIDMQVKSLVGTAFGDAYNNGQYDISSHWLCGVGLDPGELYNQFETQYYQPIGTRTTQGNATRSKLPDLDAIATQLDAVSPEDPKNKPLFNQGFEAFMKELPAMPSIQTLYPLVYNDTYWKGWPTQDDQYSVPAMWWAHFRLIISKLEATGK